MLVINIDGAAVIRDMEKIGDDKYKMPEYNMAYKYAFKDKNAFVWASKDGKDYVLALGVIVGGEKIPSELIPTGER